jgi:glucuronate isomerase
MNHKGTSAHGGIGVDTARHLFHETAAGLPLLDYHNHLPIQDLAEDRRYDNLAGCWIRTDPYKHRALRLLGVPEEQITGNVSDRQLFDTWATAVPHMAGNPLYTWNNAEWKQFFGVDKVLSPETADEIWGTTCERLKDPDFSARDPQSIERHALPLYLAVYAT